MTPTRVVEHTRDRREAASALKNVCVSSWACPREMLEGKPFVKTLTGHSPTLVEDKHRCCICIMVVMRNNWYLAKGPGRGP